MKEMIQKLKLPLTIIGVLIVGVVIYNSFIKQAPSTALLKKQSATATSSPEQNFLPILLQIQSVNLDEKLFLDPVFRALVDFSQPIIPENVGKQNPFSGTLVGGIVNASVESLGFKEDRSATNTPIITVTKKTTVKTTGSSVKK